MKMELTEKQFETLAVALQFATGYAEDSIYRSNNPDFREKIFGTLVELYNLQDYLFPETRESREPYRMQMNGGDPHADV